MTVLSAANRATNLAPSFTIPAGAAVGDCYTVVLTMNNADAVTASPAGLTQREAFASGSAISYRAYDFVVDGVTNVAGAVKTWTLSASRQWNVTAIGDSGIDTAAIYVDSDYAYVASANYTLPTLPTIANISRCFAHVHAKSNGTAITSFGTAPAGWTKRLDSSSNTTFGFAGSCGDKTADAAAGSSPGGDTWGSADQTPGSVIRTIFALKKLSSNANPVPNAGSDQTGIEAYTTVYVNGSSTDSDGTVTGVAWTQVSGASVGTITGNTSDSASFKAPGTIAGTVVVLRYTATDNLGATAFDDVSITILPVAERAVIGSAEVPMEVQAL